MQHVALITTSYPEGEAGSEAAGSFVQDFALELTRFARVTVVAAATGESVEKSGPLTVRRFMVPRTPLSLLNPLNPADWLPTVNSILAGDRALHALARQDRPTHLLALWALPSGYWARRVARRFGLNYSVWALGSDIWTLGKVPFVRQILKNVLRHAEHRFADGLQLAADVERLGDRSCDFLPSARRLPAKTGGETRKQGGTRFAYLGRWHSNKGVDLMLDALGRLADRDWEKIAEVRIYGGGPLDSLVRSEVQALQRQNRPIAVGSYLDKDRAAELIDWADYMLLPSRIESIPVIFSDAMQMRTAIVSTPVGDLPRLFAEHRVGVMAKAADASNFADAMRAALDKDARVFERAVAEAGERFDVAKIVEKFASTIGLLPL